MHWCYTYEDLRRKPSVSGKWWCIFATLWQSNASTLLFVIQKVSTSIEKLALLPPQSTEMQGCDFVLTVFSSTNPSLAAFGILSTQPTVVFSGPFLPFFFFFFFKVRLKEKDRRRKNSMDKESRGRVKWFTSNVAQLFNRILRQYKCRGNTIRALRLLE